MNETSIYREKVGPLPIWQWLVIFGVIALAMRLIVVFQFSMWVDDGATLDAISLSYGDMIAERFRMGHFPWFFVAFKLWTQLAGDSLLALRLPALLACLGAMPIIAGLAGRLAGAKGALVAAAIFVVHGTLLRHAAELRMYSWMGLFGGAMLLAMIRHAERPTAVRALVAGLLHLAFLQLHVGAAFYTVPAFAAWMVIGYRQKLPRAWWVQTALAAAVPLVITLLTLFYLRSQLDMREYAKFETPKTLFQLIETWYQLSISMDERAKDWDVYLGIALPLLAIWVIRTKSKWTGAEAQARPLPPIDLAVWYAVCGLAAPAFAFAITKAGIPVFGEPRYYIGGTAALLALFGGAAVSIKFTKNWKLFLPTALFLAAAVASTERMYYRTRRVMLKPGMGLNVMAAEIQERVPKGTTVIISDAYKVPTIAWYYFGGQEDYRFELIARHWDDNRMMEALNQATDPDEDLVLYLYKEHDGRLERFVREQYGPWSSEEESDDDQPKWMWFRRGE